MGCAEEYIGTASRSVEIDDQARRSLCGHRPMAVAKSAGGPGSQAPGRKRTLSESETSYTAFPAARRLIWKFRTWKFLMLTSSWSRIAA